MAPTFEEMERQLANPLADDANTNDPYSSFVGQSATEFGLDPSLIRSVMSAESSGRSDAVSPKGAAGLMQLMPATAKGLGVTDIYDPAQNIRGGSQYLSQMLRKYDGDVTKALAAYNWGPGNTDKWLAAGADPAGLPTETSQYIKRVTSGLTPARAPAPSEGMTFAAMEATFKPEDMFGGAEAPAAPEDEEGPPLFSFTETDPAKLGRFQSAISNVTQGFADVMAGIPKGASIAYGALTGEDPRNMAAYKFGEDLSAFVKEKTPVSPKYQEEFIPKVAGGVGSMLGFIPAAAVGGPTALAQIAGAGIVGAGLSASEQFEDAINKGASLPDAMTSAGYGSILGTTEGLPITRMLDRLDKGTGGSIRKLLSQTIKGGTEELIQETSQIIGGNLIASDLVKYDPERQMFEGVIEGGQVAFTVGGLFNFVAGLAGGRRARAPEPAPEVQDPATSPRTRAAAEQEIKRTAEYQPGPVGMGATVEGPEFTQVPVQEVGGAVGTAAATPPPVATVSPPEPPVAPPIPEEEVAVEPGVTSEEIDAAAAEADPEPTDGQKEAGNYKKAHVKVHGLDISIENAKGSERSGKDSDGEPWSVTMPAHYGYVKRTEGADGDQVDVYLGEDMDAPEVHIVDQVDADTKKFDEHKVMVGFADRETAQKTYEDGFSDGRGSDRVGAITSQSVDEFKTWLSEGDTTAPVAYEKAKAVIPATEEKPAPDLTKGWESYIEASKKIVGKKDGGIVKPGLIMRTTDATKEQAQRVIDHLRSKGQLTPKGHAWKKPTKPRDAIDIIRELGGIRPSGETRSMDLQKARPGIVRSDAPALNELRTAFEELGILPEGSVDDDVHGLIDNALRGVSVAYHPDDDHLLAQRDIEEDRERYLEQFEEGEPEAISVEFALAEIRSLEGAIEEEYNSLVAIVTDHLPPEEIYADIGEPATQADIEGIPYEGTAAKPGAEDRRREEVGEEPEITEDGEGRGEGAVAEAVAAPEAEEPSVDLRDKEIGEAIEAEERAKPRDEERDRMEVKARSVDTKIKAAKEQVAEDDLGGLFGAAETPLEKAVREDVEQPSVYAQESDLSLQGGTDAYSGTSFTPKKRAEDDISSYVSHINSFAEELLDAAETDDQKIVALEQIKKFRQGYIKHQNDLWAAKSRTISPMITGPANFPVRRNQKRMATERKRLEEILTWDKKAQKAAHKAVRNARSKEQVVSDTWDDLNQEIDRNFDIVRAVDAKEEGYRGYNRQAFTSSIKGKISRLASQGDTETVTTALTYIREKQSEMTKPFFTARNSVWGLGEKAEVEAKTVEAKPTGEDLIGEYVGAKIVDNHDDERVRILFDDIPDESLRTDLKKAGWRWSRANGAWQRKNTNAAIYSAQSIVGKHLEEEKPTEKFQLRTDEGLGLFSALGDAARAIPQAKGRAAQMLAMIRKQPGVREEEIEFTGLDAFLGDARKPVTRDEIVEFLDGNGVQVEEVVKGDAKLEITEVDPTGEGVFGDFEVFFSDRSSVLVVAENETDARAVAHEEAENLSEPAIETKFAQYTLPGGENYREVLLTLPIDEKKISGLTVDGVAKALGYSGWHSDLTKEQQDHVNRVFDAQKDRPGKGEKRGADLFKGGHYDEPNVLAHFRVNDRTGPNGEKVLFIEEIQSDWHQAGRKKGYRNEAKELARVERAESRLLAMGYEPSSDTVLVNVDTGDAAGPGGVPDGLDEAWIEYKAARKAWRSDAVPDAPFKKTWHELALKRVMRMAVEQGYDTIAWTPGEVQIDRYWGNQTISDAVDRFKEVAKPQSVRELAQNVFGSEMVAAMPLEVVDGSMLPLLQKDQVIDAVVSNLPVDVVDFLSENKVTAKQVLSNDPVVIDRLSVNGRARVADGIISATRLTGTSIRAELSSAMSAGRDVELLPTLRASDLNSREVAGLLSPQSIFHLGASPTPEEAAAARAAAETPSSGGGRVGRGKLAATELAELLNNHVRIIHGDSGLLQQGFEVPPGEGMKSFYDKMLVNAANKITKKLGTKVEVIDLKGAQKRFETGEADMVREEGTSWIVEYSDGGIVRVDMENFPDNADAEIEANRIRSTDDPGQQVWSLPITDKMRDVVGTKGLPLFQLPSILTRIAADIKPLTKNLRDQLTDLGLSGKIAMNLRDRIVSVVDGKAQVAEGRYYSKTIEVALDARDPEHTLNHEAVHALHDMGLFSTREWGALQSGARADAERMSKIKSVYPDLSASEQTEEAIAEWYADWARGDTEVTGLMARAFEKIKAFFEALANALKARGFTTAEDVFGAVERGEVGAREGVEGEADKKFQRTPTLTKMKTLAAKVEKDGARVMGSATQEAAIERIMATTDVPVAQKMRDTVSELKDRKGLAMKQAILDQFASIEALERDENAGEVLDASLSAYKAARMTQNLQSVMASVLRQGPMEVYETAEGGKWFRTKQNWDAGGFEEIFKGLGERGLLRLWKGWAAANRAQRLAEEGRENLMSDAEIEDLLSLEKQYPEFRTALDKWAKFNKTMLDMAEDAGLMNADQRALWENDDYVPFFRIFEEDVVGAARGKGGLAGQSSGIRRLTGGLRFQVIDSAGVQVGPLYDTKNKAEDAIRNLKESSPDAKYSIKETASQLNDIIENMVMNLTSLVDRSFKTLAAQKVKDLAVDAGIMHKVPMNWSPIKVSPEEAAQQLENIGVQVMGMTPEQHAEVLKMWQMKAPTEPDVVSVMVDGKPQYYRVDDPLLLNSLTSLAPSQLGNVMKLFRMSKRLLTTGVTTDPAFMMANLIRDTLSSWVVTGQTGLIPGVGTIQGLIKSLRNDPSLTGIMAAGGGSGGFYRTDPDDVRKMLGAEIRGINKKTIVDTPKKMWELWNRLGAASESANRVAIYDVVKKNGGTDAEAAYQALDVMDFSKRGESAAMRTLIEMVPFMNARIQGLDRLYRGAKENPKGFMLRGSIIMAASLALLAENWDDERYEALEEWDKDTYYHFWIDDDHFRLPKPFEVGAIFSTIPERMFRYLMGKDTEKVAAGRALAMVRDTFAMNPTPQLVMPIVEEVANRSFFTGRPIIGMGLDRLPAEMQAKPSTGPMATMLAKLMPDSLPDAMRSPARIEHMIKGYFGTLGTYALAASDSMARGLLDLPAKPANRWDDVPVIKRFYREDPARSTKYMTEFYEIKREVEKAVAGIREARRRGWVEDARKMMKKSRDKIAIRKIVQKAGKAMSDLSREMRLIHTHPTMGAQEKRRRIDKLTRDRNRIAEQIVAKIIPRTQALVKKIDAKRGAAQRIRDASNE